jgi:hypothetical protein
MVMEYSATIKTMKSTVVKALGIFIEIFSKKPNKMPEKVINNALSLSIVS